ncbi:MAG: SHOCT domain-containing protein [Spirochaetia bacterium]|nr:SHOCT domain-containing protein [Spirochaetia bacterium]
MKRYLPVLLILISFTLTLSCRSKFNRLEYLNEYENLAIYRIKADDFPSKKSLKEQISPPKVFPLLTPEQIIDFLGNFEFIRNSFWGNLKRRVFYEEELKYMAPYISHQLSNLGDQYRLVIVSRFDPDQSVLSRMERVSAVIWLDEDGLNVVFGEIRTEIPDNDYFSYDESWKEVYPVSLRRSFYDLSLVDAEYFQKKFINGRYHQTWAVIPEGNFKSLRYKPEEADIESEGNTMSLSEKLKDLKKAKEEGLITDDEYEAKRKKLIDSL